MRKRLRSKRILVLRTEHIGDFVLTLPALKFLREKYPVAKIDILVGPWNKKLAEACPYVDSVFVFDNPLIKRGISFWEIFREISFGIGKYLRVFGKFFGKYDLVVSFSDRKISRLLGCGIFAKKKVYGDGFERMNERERILKVVEGNDPGKILFDYDFSRVDKILKNNENFVVGHLFSPDKNKNFSLNKWKKIFSEIDGKVFLIGGKEDYYGNKKICDFLGKRCDNLAGKLDLIESFYLISKAREFFGVDSGPAQMARIGGTWSNVFFKSSDSFLWGPMEREGTCL